MEQTNAMRCLPWVVATPLFMEQTASTIVKTALPAMAASLNVSPLSLKGVVASYLLSLAVDLPVQHAQCVYPSRGPSHVFVHSMSNLFDV